MNNLNLKKLAQQATTLAEIMEGRDKLDTEDIIKNFPDGFHIDEVEYVTIQKTEGNKDDKKIVTDEFWAFHIKESPDTFSFAGTILAKIFNTALVACDGSYDDLNELFQAQPLHVKLAMGKTKNKNQIATVEIL